MKKLVNLLIVPLTAAGLLHPVVAHAQNVGAKYGSRDPHTCASRKAPARGAITAAQARQYFICDNEFEKTSLMDRSKKVLQLVTGVTIEVGNGRRFDLVHDATPQNNDEGIDPHFEVYPIRGSFVLWGCEQTNTYGFPPGKNCSKMPQPQATGICFRSSFNEWHCNMQDFKNMQMTMHLPPPRN